MRHGIYQGAVAFTLTEIVRRTGEGEKLVGIEGPHHGSGVDCPGGPMVTSSIVVRQAGDEVDRYGGWGTRVV